MCTNLTLRNLIKAVQGNEVNISVSKLDEEVEIINKVCKTEVIKDEL